MLIFKNHLFSSAWPNFAHTPSPGGRSDGLVATLYLQPPTSAIPAQATFLQFSNHTSVPGKIQIGPSWGCSSWTHHCDQTGLYHMTASLIRSHYWQLTPQPLKEIRSRKNLGSQTKIRSRKKQHDSQIISMVSLPSTTLPSLFYTLLSWGRNCFLCMKLWSWAEMDLNPGPGTCVL